VSPVSSVGQRVVESHCGGWYDIALTAPRDTSFAYQLAGRLESAGRLTSDPQLGDAPA
jgi:phospholipase C